jgi:cytochrome c5
MNSRTPIRFPRSLALVLGLAVVGLPAQALTFHTESQQLPESHRVFPGNDAGANAANGSCLMCHSAGMVMTQPRLSSDAWRAEVNKMRNTFKAPIPEDKVETLVKYLAALPPAP